MQRLRQGFIIGLSGLSFMALFTAILAIAGCKPAAPGEPKLHTPSKSELEKWSALKDKLLAMLSYDAYGKVAYNSGKGGGNANVHWEQRDKKYLIELGGALGSGIRITGQPNLVSLMKPTGELAVAKTEEELLQKTLGFNIPIAGMSYWLKGIPSPKSTPTKIMFDPNYNLALLEQDGWTIKYDGYSETNGLNLPGNISFENSPVKLKVVLNQWSFKAPVTPAPSPTSSSSSTPAASTTTKAQGT